jgi:hypothetical protein
MDPRLRAFWRFGELEPAEAREASVGWVAGTTTECSDRDDRQNAATQTMAPRGTEILLTRG